MLAKQKNNNILAKHAVKKNPLTGKTYLIGVPGAYRGFFTTYSTYRL